MIYKGPYTTDMMTFAMNAPTQTIKEEIVKHHYKFASGHYKKIMVSVSGGADSDRMIDMIERFGYPFGTVEYHYYDTGMEFRATKDHLNYLENKYGIEIVRHKAKMPVPVAVKKYGYPFLNKNFSNYIHRLQRNNFKWEDKPFEVLYAEYPKCKAALRWWCNKWGEKSQNNISRRKYLKEFMIENPPDFPISDQCCQKAKKDTANQIAKEINPDLDVIGIRKAEGGSRAQSYSGCFDEVQFGCSHLRPLYWFRKTDCIEYDKTFGIEHSLCYTLYGLDRTGCACCPFGKYWENELKATENFEPKLYQAAMNVFGPSYTYTKQYYEYRDKRS